MENENNLKDESKKVVKKIQLGTAIQTLCDADLRRRLVSQGTIDTSLTIGDALKMLKLIKKEA